jgi:hypothetical protein
MQALTQRMATLSLEGEMMIKRIDRSLRGIDDFCAFVSMQATVGA